MKPADLLKKNYPPSILIYGPMGTGKTALVSQLSNAYLFDFDRGMRTAAKLQDKFFDARQNIEFDIYRDPNPNEPIMYQKAMRKILDIVQACANKTWDHDAVIVDSLTGLCMAAQLQIAAAGGDAFKKMEIQDWGSLITAVEKFLTLMRSLSILTIVTAHVDFIEAKKIVKGKIVIGETDITDMFPSSATKRHGFKKLMWLFDEIWYANYREIGAGKLEYRVTGIPTGIIKARSRSGIGTVIHNNIGMAGLLNMAGYKCGEAKNV